MVDIYLLPAYNDVSVLSHFKTESDYRLVRAIFRFDVMRGERTKIMTTASQKPYEKHEVAILQDMY